MTAHHQYVAAAYIITVLLQCCGLAMVVYYMSREREIRAWIWFASLSAMSFAVVARWIHF